jgi:diaminohydroxyphosphoribosylaminopyrimidine deaminase/5-amino-6-(5-phosphoribosylamino)uracil reductase
MVGAVLVHQDRIIGEGYHEQYGGPHAEVNCIGQVAEADRHLIKRSRLYVALEPCAHHGKTPPCADLVIAHQIPEVVIACRDSFEQVNGHGIEKLRKAGIQVTEGVLQAEALELNKRFFCFHQHKRPYVFLKWAQSSDGFIAKKGFEKVSISNAYTNRYTHRARAHEAAIMVGTRTALHDNPSLTCRWWPGKNPLRIVIDKELVLPPTAAILNSEAPTLILNLHKEAHIANLHFHKIRQPLHLLPELMALLYEKNIVSLVVEGGTELLQSFINSGIWDEATVITNEKLKIGVGVSSPLISPQKMESHFSLFGDLITSYKNHP